MVVNTLFETSSPGNFLLWGGDFLESWGKKCPLFENEISSKMLWISASQFVLFFYLTFSTIWFSAAYPQRPGLKEGTVGESMHVDRDDGEEWYPVEGGQGEPLPVPQPRQNQLADDLLEAVRNIFIKFGYSVDEIPQPFGNADPAIPFRSTAEFINILELLVEKLPSELDLPILHILKDNGVYELRVPKGLYENSIELRKVDEIIAQIEHLSGQQPPPKAAEQGQNRDKPKAEIQEAEVDGKYDTVRQAMTMCEGSPDACSPTTQKSSGPTAMKHPSIKTPPGKLLVARRGSRKENAAKLKKDKKKLEVLIQEVKETVSESEGEGKPLAPAEGSKVAEDLSKISEIVAEVESIAEENVKTLEENPCKSGSAVDAKKLQELDSLIKKLEKDEASGKNEPKNQVEEEKEEKVRQDLDEIKNVIRKLEAENEKSTDSNIPEPSEENPSFQGMVNDINKVISEMQQYKASQQGSAPENTENAQLQHQLMEMDTIMKEIRAYQSQDHPPSMDDHGNVKAMDEIMNQMRAHQSQMSQNHPAGTDLHDNVKAMDEIMNQMRAHQVQNQPANDHIDNVKAMDDIMNQMRAHQSQQQPASDHNGNVKAMDDIMKQMRAHQSQTQPPSDHNVNVNDKVKTMDDIMNQMRAHQSHQSQNPLAEADQYQEGKENADVKAIDQMMEDIRKYQAEFHPEIVSNTGAEADLKAIDSLIQDMKNYESARSFIEPQELPPQSHHEDIKTMDSIIRGMEGQKVNQKMNQIIQAMERQNSDSDRKASHGNKVNQMDEIMRGIQQHQAKIPLEFGHPDLGDHERGDKLREMDSIISQMKNSPPAQAHVAEVPNPHPDLTQFEETMNQMRGFQQAQAKIPLEFDHPDLERGETLRQMDSIIGKMKNSPPAQAYVAEVPNPHPDLAQFEETMNKMRGFQQAQAAKESVAHVPRHGGRDEEVQKLDALIDDIKKMAKAQAHQESIPAQTDQGHVTQINAMDNIVKDMRSKYGAVQPPQAESEQNIDDQLQMLDSIIKEIGQIAKQEEKHIEAEAEAGKVGEIEEIMKQMKSQKTKMSQSQMSEASDTVQPHPHVGEIDRIMADLQKESLIERDLQQALDEVKHSEHFGQHEQNAFMGKTNKIMSDMADIQRKQASGGEFQTREEAKELDKIMDQMRKHQNKADAKVVSDEFQQMTNQAKGKMIQEALKGNPKYPDPQRQRSKDAEAGIAAVKSHLPGSKDVEEIDKIMDQIREIQNGLSSQGQIKEDKLNAADEGYLRRLKQWKLRKSKARKQ